MADNTHETKIVISGDATIAVNSLKLVQAQVGKLIGYVKNAFSILGKINWVIGGIQTVIEGCKKIYEWMNRAARAAAQMRIDSVFKAAADSMDRLISRQTIYNKLLKEELADLSRRKELQGIETSGKERRETEKREIARAKEIAGAANEDEERAIRQRWAEEDELRERGKRYRELKDNVTEETEKSAIYGSKAGAAEANVKAADDAIADLRANMIRMSDDQKKEAKKQIEAIKEKRKANAEAAAEYRKEEEMAEKRAELYRQQIEDVNNGGGVAKAKNEAENAKIAREKTKKSEKSEKEQKTSDRNLEDKKLARQKEEDLAALDPSSPDYERRKKEIERTYEIRAAEEKERRAENETDRQAAKEEREAIGIRQERERAEERASLASGLVERAASFDGVSQNRLTAMGLGSGVSATGGVASDVKKLVDLLKQEVEESKKANNRDDETSSATYAE